VQILAQGPGAVQITNNLIDSTTTAVDIENSPTAGNITVASNSEIFAKSGAGVSISNVAAANITIGGSNSGDANTINVFNSGSGVMLSSVTGSISVVGNAFGTQFISAPLNGVNANTIQGNLTVRGNEIHSDSTALIAAHVTGNVTVAANDIHSF